MKNFSKSKTPIIFEFKTANAKYNEKFIEKCLENIAKINLNQIRWEKTTYLNPLKQISNPNVAIIFAQVILKNMISPPPNQKVTFARISF